MNTPDHGAAVPNPASDPSLLLGTLIGTGRQLFDIYQDGTEDEPRAFPPSRVTYDKYVFAAHMGKPWMRHYLRKYHRTVLMDSETDPTAGKTVSVPMSLLKQHAVVLGASGYGKTRQAMHLLKEQMRAGYSAVVMDIKKESIRQALAFALEAGVPRDKITVVWPENAEDGVPGWNPLTLR